MNSSFVSPVDDILFCLRHVANATDLDDWDDELADDILQAFAALAENELAPLNAIGDNEGARLENGRVLMPPGFQEAYRQLANDGWQGLTAPERFGGQAVSKLIAGGVSEIFSGANHSLQMVCNLVPGAIETLLRFGSEEQQAKWIPRLASGDVLSTMCLTEPAAGSDLSSIRCRAMPLGNNWQLSGEKIFISGGDQNLSNGILHLVLARSGDVRDRLGGLSLFLCQSQPAIQVSRLEKKLGLKASPTCQLLFDDADAELLGEEGQGLQAMFSMMNYARIDVALQGVAHSSHASRLARHYASERVQGKNAKGDAAVLSDHADVQRMLDEQQLLTHAARAMCCITLMELQHGQRPELIDFLTPLCKIAGSEAGIRSADLAIQVLGGYGYLHEYGAEQIWRDARITAIYEGANGIHARTLVGRCLRKGVTVELFASLINDLAIDTNISQKSLQWQTRAKQLAEMDDPLPYAHEFSSETIKLFSLAVWARIRAVAHHHPQNDQLSRLADLHVS